MIATGGIRWLGALTASCALAACAPSGSTPDPADLGAPLDLTTRSYVGARTGAACTADSDCAPSPGVPNVAARCRKSFPFIHDGLTIQLPMPSGFCMSPCNYDPESIHRTSPDCPSEDALCVPFSMGGLCWSACLQTRDCRDGYVCGYAFSGVGLPACMPLATSYCDPAGDPRPQGKSCALGDTCVTFGPDNAFGVCLPSCDPVTQDCKPGANGPENCVLDIGSKDGSGFCQPLANLRDGESCTYNGSCGLGMYCYNGTCRYVCRTGGAAGGPLSGLCPQGQTCADLLNADIDVAFHADKTGICHP